MMVLNLQFFGGRGSSGGNSSSGKSPASSTESSSNVEVPKRINAKNMTEEIFQKLMNDYNSVPKGTVISLELSRKDDYFGNMTLTRNYKYEGDGVWKLKTDGGPGGPGSYSVITNGYRSNIKETDESGESYYRSYKDHGYTNQQATEAILKSDLKDWAKQHKKNYRVK